MRFQGFLKHMFVSREADGEDITIYVVDVDDSDAQEGHEDTDGLAENAIAEEPSTKSADSLTNTFQSITELLSEFTFSAAVLLINWVLALVSLLSFLAIIAYPILSPSSELPDVISNVFAATIGYFGSALVVYLERHAEKAE